jgi:hypothetical protein
MDKQQSLTPLVPNNLYPTKKPIQKETTKKSDNQENRNKKENWFHMNDTELKYHEKFLLFFGIIWFLMVIVIVGVIDSSRNKEITQVQICESSYSNYLLST